MRTFLAPSMHSLNLNYGENCPCRILQSEPPYHDALTVTKLKESSAFNSFVETQRQKHKSAKTASISFCM